MWSLNIVDGWQSTIWNLSCTNAKRVIYPGTRTQVFFVLLVLYQKTFSPLVTMLFKLCLATYFQKNLLMARFASNPFQVVYLFSNKKITIYPYCFNVSLNYLQELFNTVAALCVSVCSSLVCLCNGLAVLK